MSLVDPIFTPLLSLTPFWAVFIVSLLVSLIIIVIYKFATNQEEMKHLKDELKNYQKQMKELRSQPEKMMEVQKKAMKLNMKYMSHSMKATLFTFIPIILIFSWMNGHYAYIPIMPGQDFTTTVISERGISDYIELSVPEGINIKDEAKKQITSDTISWTLNGDKGEYLLEYKINEKTYTKDIIITSEQNYAEPVKNIKDSKIKAIKIDYNPLKIVNLLGWKIGWLGTYIIFSIAFSIILRKIMKVY